MQGMPKSTAFYVSMLVVHLASFIVSCQPLTPSEDRGEEVQEKEGDKKGEDDPKKEDDPNLRPPEPIPTELPTPVPTPIPVIVPLRLEPTDASMTDGLISSLCISCHREAISTNRYVNLTDLAAVITTTPDTTTPGQQRKVVRAGCPELSMFFLSMKNGSMPKDPTKRLSPENLKAVSDWIVSLNRDPALNCSDEPPD